MDGDTVGEEAGEYGDLPDVAAEGETAKTLTEKKKVGKGGKEEGEWSGVRH